MSSTVAVAVALLADGAPRNTGPDFGKASPVGLLIIVLLMIGTFALIWSMNRHLRKLPERFNPKQSDDQGDDAAHRDSVGESSDSADNPEGSRHDPSG
jgi:hypothetical protein